MLFSKSQEVITLISTHSNQVIECYNNYMFGLEKIWEGCSPDDKETIYSDIQLLESKADVIRRNIIRKLFEGRLLVTSRKSIMRLIEDFDTIADISEEVIRDLYIQEINISKEWQEPINQINQKTHTQLILLSEVIHGLLDKFDTGDMLTKITQIEKIESDVDKIEYTLLNTLFRSDLPLAEKLQLKNFITLIGSISDTIEDLSDEIEIIMMARGV